MSLSDGIKWMHHPNAFELCHTMLELGPIQYPVVKKTFEIVGPKTVSAISEMARAAGLPPGGASRD